ncbi:MAG: FMN-binding negative transcriptional regulator [Fibrobacterota bacterium]|nr:FMN-binding negative transcriptional regulator [Fibrobacterota bacterium]
MYIPKAFEETNSEVLVDHINHNSFATVISSTDDGPMVSHLPMYYLKDGENEFLIGHLAKANEHWKFIEGKGVVIFHGPHAYISSKWYGTSNVVPTWNYISVHVAGEFKLTDSKELVSILDFMVHKHEGNVQQFKNYNDEKFLEVLSNQIVGIKLEVKTIKGKWKLSQNKSEEIQKKIAENLIKTGEYNSIEIAGKIYENLKIKT